MLFVCHYNLFVFLLFGVALSAYCELISVGILLTHFRSPFSAGTANNEQAAAKAAAVNADSGAPTMYLNFTECLSF
jgi:hypothetical protein